uniref:Major capsid protein n=1 Tax=Siphoviridae sp. ctnMR5 TaxID=2825658 RepID=A0A8S5U8W7_9CAUD|nr:MAG TPA: hypothetical protein [Siphoviridae sp. ctnMR5]
MLKLNSLDGNIFTVDKINDVTVKTNSGVYSRNDIIAKNRLATCEYVGTNINKCNPKEKYNSRLAGSGVDYATLSRVAQERKILFCAAQAYKAMGINEVPTDFKAVKHDTSLSKNPIFLATLAAIDREVLQPLFFSVIDDVAMGGLMHWESAELGATKEITVGSNDTFIFEDSAWGSGRSTSKNYLYAKTITLTPKMYSCNATIKWYQDIVNGDAGRYYAAIIRGMWNKIYAQFLGYLKGAVSNTALIPAGLVKTTYNSENWNSLTTLVAAANGLRRENLVAFGGISALSKVLPTDGAAGAITGLQYGLGEEWFKQGYLPNASGVQLLEVLPAIVPGTQNSSLETIDLGKNIFISGKAGDSYAPMYGVYAEGSPITLELTPRETANFEIDINVGAMFDVKPVFASKIGVITNVG